MIRRLLAASRISDSANRRWPVAIISASLISATFMVSFGRADVHRLHPTPIHPVASVGSSLPPPPAALAAYYHQFIRLYASYALLAGEKPSFAQWLIVNGVVHPTTHHAMLLLYIWAERNSP